MKAYSAATDTEYESWQDLLAAETNGFVVVGVTTRPHTSPVVIGPFAHQAEARRAQARLRRRWKATEAPKFQVSTYVRHLWKGDQ